MATKAMFIPQSSLPLSMWYQLKEGPSGLRLESSIKDSRSLNKEDVNIMITSLVRDIIKPEHNSITTGRDGWMSRYASTHSLYE